MKSFFLHASFSGVKKMVISTLTLSAASLLLLVGPATTANAQGVTINNSSCKDAEKEPCGAGEIAYVVSRTDCNTGNGTIKVVDGWSCRADCATYKKELDDAANAATSGCTEAGLGTLPKCVKTMKECVLPSSTEGTSDSFMDAVMPMVNQVGGALMGGANLNLGSANTRSVNKGQCANMSYRDYFEQKDRIKRDLETAQKDINELKTKMSDAVKDFNEKKAELTKEANEAQKTLSEQKTSLSKEKREQQAQLQTSQSETAEKIRQLNTQLMAKRAEIARTESQFTQKLANMTSALGETKCIAEATAMREELKKIFGTSWSAQSKKTAALEEKFKNCLANFQMERRELMNQRTSYLTQAQNEISNIQENINEATQSLESMAKTNQEILAEMSKNENELVQQATQAISVAQTQMADAATNLQQTQTNIAQEQSELTARITSLNQDLEMLGPAPSSGATKNWTSAQSAVMTYYSKLGSIPEGCEGKVGSTHKTDNSQYKDMKKAIENSGLNQK